MKKAMFILLGLGIIAILGGIYMYNKPVASLKNKKPELEVTATQLVADYESDESSADTKYLGKVLQVEGNVVDIIREGGKTKVHLASDSPMAVVICEMEEGSEPGDVKAGETVTMKGKCTGFLSDVILDQSFVVKK